MHKSGYANIIGLPNAGKSTLMNVLVGERLSIITSKAQTTRHRILGVVNGDDYQLIFSDTPGVLKPNYGMQSVMMKFVNESLMDADVLIYLVDPKEREKADEDFIHKLSKNKAALIVCLNKTDLLDKAEVAAQIQALQKVFPDADIVPVSALKKKNTAHLLELIISKLPVHPPYYSKDTLTDKPERFFASEIIREKIFLNYKQEIPYSCEVAITAFKDEPGIIKIEAEIYVNRQSQKSILIGKAGSMLKKVGTEARKDMEAFFLKKVFLKTYVKVKENWRDDERQLKGFGYQ